MVKNDSAIPKAIANACTKTASPFHIGVSIGRFLYNIEDLVTTHLEHDVKHQLAVPATLQWAPDFVHAIADHMFKLRTDRDLLNALEDVPMDIYDRKARYKQRKCKEKYVWLVQVKYKQCICEVLGELFESWNPIKTQEFNKGVDKALTRTQWKVYPLSNVVLEARDGDWVQWLTERCEELGRAARKAHEDVAGVDLGYEMWELCDER